MNKTKIEWCDCTINPVVGCKNGCPYCYARRMNDRFHFIPKWEEPQFFPERLKALESKKSKVIFMNSMSDYGFWEQEWKDKVFKAIRENPQHSYIFLTKHDSFYNPFYYSSAGENCGYKVYFGKTHTKGTYFAGYNDKAFDFLSIEPILGNVDISNCLEGNGQLKQIIIGAETGNRKGKVIPKKEWIDDLCKQADEMGIKVFMKDSLIPIVGEENMRRELIWR